MKTFSKVIIVTISILALLLAATLCFFAFTYQWVVTRHALLLFIPLLVAAVLVTLFFVYFFRRKKWRWGFIGIGISILVLAYTGLIPWNYSHIVIREPQNNPVVTSDTDENRILTLLLSGNISNGRTLINRGNKYYVVIAPDNDNYGYFKDKIPQECNGYKSRLIDEYKKSNESDNSTLQNLSGLFDKFVELNKQPWRLSLKSSTRDGYYRFDETLNGYPPGFFPVDYYLPPVGIRQYFNLGFIHWERPSLGVFDIFGWGKWRLYGRDFAGYFQLSIPAYDKETGMVILYESGAYAGYLYIFKYENGSLYLKTGVGLWVS
jgi:hypothetical protein